MSRFIRAGCFAAEVIVLLRPNMLVLWTIEVHFLKSKAYKTWLFRPSLPRAYCKLKQWLGKLTQESHTRLFHRKCVACAWAAGKRLCSSHPWGLQPFGQSGRQAAWAWAACYMWETGSQLPHLKMWPLIHNSVLWLLKVFNGRISTSSQCNCHSFLYAAVKGIEALSLVDSGKPIYSLPMKEGYA